jgi:UDP-N-acetylglucosamine--N-acetylmuramyl-(pentapeptide) pyrophosphoryl-undecaprenol N-acetylglucosamine transferase
MTMPKFIISGGGTGGHIYPAIAIAQTLQQKFPDAEILFVGATGKMEMEKVPKAGFKIVGLPIRGFQRSLSAENLKFPFRLVVSLWKAYQIIREFRPDVCIGVGGFASGAVMQMAVLQGIPTLIQEQNSYAGVTNKLLAKFVNKICTAYPNMSSYFPAEKIVFCGNPVRQDLLNSHHLKEQAQQFFSLSSSKKTLLIVGGSLGAKSINESILQGINSFLEADIQLLWQTGKTDFARIQAELQAKGLAAHPNLVVREFIYEMHYAYAAADCVVSRAGALAISEIALAQKPTIFVPYPYAAEDHQTKNAEVLVNAQAALLVKDQVAQQALVGTTLALLADEKMQAVLTKNIQPFGKPQAAADIVREIINLL